MYRAVAVVILAVLLAGATPQGSRAAAAARPAEKPQIRVTQAVLGKFPASGHWRQLVVTDAGRVLYTMEDGGRSTTYLDGKPIEGYDEVVHDSLIGSPDGRRYAFVASRGGKQFAVVDGREGPPYHEVPRFHPAARERFLFSPDGRHVVYLARGADGRSAVVRDGRAELPYKEVGRIAFSPDSRHLAYPGDRVMIIDGTARPEYRDLTGDGLTYSVDSRATAYMTMNEGEVVVTGEHARTYRTPGRRVHQRSVVLGPGGKTVFWRASWWEKDGQRAAIYRDGEPVKPDGTTSSHVAFSADGGRVAYAATLDSDDERVDPGSVLVVDGVEHRTPWEIDVGTLRFSPDGRRLGYVATQYLSPPPHYFAASLRQWVVVRDPEGNVTARDGEQFLFSPDSRHVVRFGEGLLAVGDAEAPLHRNDLPRSVTFDGPRAVRAVVARHATREILRLDLTLHGE